MQISLSVSEAYESILITSMPAWLRRKEWFSRIKVEGSIYNVKFSNGIMVFMFLCVPSKWLPSHVSRAFCYLPLPKVANYLHLQVFKSMCSVCQSIIMSFISFSLFSSCFEYLPQADVWTLDFSLTLSGYLFPVSTDPWILPAMIMHQNKRNTFTSICGKWESKYARLLIKKRKKKKKAHISQIWLTNLLKSVIKMQIKEHNYCTGVPWPRQNRLL